MMLRDSHLIRTNQRPNAHKGASKTLMCACLLLTNKWCMSGKEGG